MSTVSTRFKEVREALHLSQDAIAQELGVSRNYISLIETGAKDPSMRLVRALETIRMTHANKSNRSPHLIKGDPRDLILEEPRGKYEQVASRIPLSRQPSTRTECEAYVQQLFDAAELSEDPNAFPVIHDRMKKQFPLDEWDPQSEKKD